SGPFHSQMMHPAEETLQHVLKEAELRDPLFPVIANVNAAPCTTAEAAEKNLVRQLSQAVLFEQSIRWCLDQGITTFIEMGPGHTLAGLIKKIDRQVRVISLEKIGDLEKALELA
ncbi:MAG: [acyl-carrier-protein] S-malonyltransferase, partial [Firmicutes bacterium]|nr:[acyl-carrier-protein] S-malonyltransferase [Bacillota bacterium]